MVLSSQLHYKLPSDPGLVWHRDGFRGPVVTTLCHQRTAQHNAYADVVGLLQHGLVAFNLMHPEWLPRQSHAWPWQSHQKSPVCTCPFCALIPAVLAAHREEEGPGCPRPLMSMVGRCLLWWGKATQAGSAYDGSLPPRPCPATQPRLLTGHKQQAPCATKLEKLLLKSSSTSCRVGLIIQSGSIGASPPEM